MNRKEYVHPASPEVKYVRVSQTTSFPFGTISHRPPGGGFLAIEAKISAEFVRLRLPVRIESLWEQPTNPSDRPPKVRPALDTENALASSEFDFMSYI